ncbi:MULTISPECIES: PhzF family phenazine biosynthesis protein [Kordiimonas]|jgi:PhzF family phenazine biosynthesis protein|uniref:PhzF family phenazine biosynthesis protein n=1 Tax=Kordiimonas TaxID=288021 RepID=UPI00257E1B79|nr:PhzF family phenazine biosynthesis protein [Kordiimonas sp. UBA4487]
MRELPVYQVDAFTSQPFGGNPAAVCPLPAFLDDALLQNIALENNLAETAFIVPSASDDVDYELRWFTPAIEVQLCGHATLASAHVVFKHLHPDWEMVRFNTASGLMTVVHAGDFLEMNFPNLHPTPMSGPEGLAEAMGAAPSEVLDANTGDDDLLLVYDNAQTIRTLAPDPLKMAALSPYGFIVTAPGDDGIDFVSRCFFPNKGIPEDPVTGSAHCAAAPYWAQRLGKQELRAKQVSARGGDLWLKVVGDRVKVSGQAVEVMRGTLLLP